MTEATDELLYEVRDRIGWVTFNRPAARNSMTFAMYEGLAEICEAAHRDDGLKALVLTGAGDKAFAAGTDIAQFQTFKGSEDGIAYERKIDRIVDTIERCSVPTIAAIAGFCTGGGAAIAAVCDLRLATANAQFGFPIARTLGNCLSMANYARLAALIGPQRTKEVIFLAKLIDGPTALGIGLVSELLPDAASLHARAEEMARTVANHAPITLQVTKEALRRLQARLGDDDIDDLIRLAYGSADFREGMAAFLAKRAPKWSGT
jgi:enoyl-CoA hydratase/carnithine racemase